MNPFVCSVALQNRSSSELMRADIIEGNFEFHRDDEGNVTIVERVHPTSNQIVIIPAHVWGQIWPKLVSVHEFRELSNQQWP